MLDETQLEPGKLESSGINSVMHISNLIRNQKLNVNFKFYNIDYNSNVPVLLLSEGKSMFPVSATLFVMFLFEDKFFLFLYKFVSDLFVIYFFFISLQSNCHVPIKPDDDSINLMHETFTAIKQFIKPKLNLFRTFLTELRLREFDMNPENMSMIQNDFVEMRKEFNATADDLHSMLILSRMLGIIQNKTILDAESWNQAKQMEAKRRHRIELLPKKKN